MSCTKDGKFGGSLDLIGLTSAKDLVLPNTVGGYLYLSGLTSAKDLVLPKTMGGYLDLRGLSGVERNMWNTYMTTKRKTICAT